MVGFERSRLDTTRTGRLFDQFWEPNLYRHPERQGIQPEEDLVMQQDIYLLGVVLLEIGLKPYLFFNKAKASPEPGEGSVSPRAQLDFSDILQLTNVRKRAKRIKRRLVSVAKAKVPSAVGQKYTQS